MRSKDKNFLSTQIRETKYLYRGLYEIKAHIKIWMFTWATTFTGFTSIGCIYSELLQFLNSDFNMAVTSERLYDQRDFIFLHAKLIRLLFQEAK